MPTYNGYTYDRKPEESAAFFAEAWRKHYAAIAARNSNMSLAEYSRSAAINAAMPEYSMSEAESDDAAAFSIENAERAECACLEIAGDNPSCPIHGHEDRLTLRDLKSGARLESPIYLYKPFVVLNSDDVVLAAGDWAYLFELSAYYDDCTVEVRRHDMYLNDNTRIEGGTK